ncbi:hypothetical protein NQ176_g9340 [Zarea fungicola]|uniref:Uncharacterized protein n=1 Tax=Zarea fungicola TaxID=93591 RepID=A0ACC1MPG0_9HYPO|nr:hypothetical protein NQ176_g9340 [Lecanicillium fungicola]
MGQASSSIALQTAFVSIAAAATPCLPPDLKQRFKTLSKDLLSNDVAQVVIKVAQRGQPGGANKFPHDTTKDTFAYNYMDPGWWTSGFFPGTLWLLYERSLTLPQPIASSDILNLALQWQKGMEAQQFNKGTHDLGFMIMPEFYSDYALRNSTASRDIVINAAHSLATRWNETVQCIRSISSSSSTT